MRNLYTKEQLEAVVKESRSFRDVVIRLGKKPHGGSIDHYKDRINKFEIDTSHFVGNKWNVGNVLKKRKTSEEILVKGKKLHAYMLRRAMLEKGVIYMCSCGINEWNSKKLNLEVDHIDGDNENNELLNLRFLCPNCHSQTNTYKFYGRKHTRT